MVLSITLFFVSGFDDLCAHLLFSCSLLLPWLGDCSLEAVIEDVKIAFTGVHVKEAVMILRANQCAWRRLVWSPAALTKIS